MVMSQNRRKRGRDAESKNEIEQRKALHKVVVRVATGAAAGMSMLFMPVIAIALSFNPNKGFFATNKHLGDLENYGTEIEDTGPEGIFREYTINIGEGGSIIAVKVPGADGGDTHQN